MTVQEHFNEFSPTAALTLSRKWQCGEWGIQCGTIPVCNKHVILREEREAYSLKIPKMGYTVNADSVRAVVSKSPDLPEIVGEAPGGCMDKHGKAGLVFWQRQKTSGCWLQKQRRGHLGYREQSREAGRPVLSRGVWGGERGVDRFGWGVQSCKGNQGESCRRCKKPRSRT